MIVPVKRWASLTLLRPSKTEVKVGRHEHNEERVARPSLLETFEQMLRVQTNMMLRGLDE